VAFTVHHHHPSAQLQGQGLFLLLQPLSGEAKDTISLGTEKAGFISILQNKTN
jgi:hypothetical protein